MKRKSDSMREKKIKRKRLKKELQLEEYTPITVKVGRTPLKALTRAQGRYVKSITNNIITFGIGPAGTGKSYVAIGMACDKLLDGSIEQLIITRPAVEAGESLGYLPGDVTQKYEEYLIPFMSIFNERLGSSQTKYMIKRGIIKARPLAFMRGLTFTNAWVILDEAQNTSESQMQMFLTRIGQDCKVIVDGDMAQKDIRGNSGLLDVVTRFTDMPGIGIVKFDVSDIVRSGIVRKILERYVD